MEEILAKMPPRMADLPELKGPRKYRPISPIVEYAISMEYNGSATTLIENHMEEKEMESPEKLRPIDLSKLDQKLRKNKSKREIGDSDTERSELNSIRNGEHEPGYRMHESIIIQDSIIMSQHTKKATVKTRYRASNRPNNVFLLGNSESQ